MELPTLKVRWPEAFGDDVIVINAADFDPQKHQKVVEGEDATEAKVEAEQEAAPEGEAPPAKPKVTRIRK